MSEVLSEAERDALMHHIGAWKWQSKPMAIAEAEFMHTVEAIVAARVASAAAENAELRSRIDEVRALIPECYMFRSSSMSPVCTDFIGGKIADGPGVFTEDMCCLPCRLRAVLAPAHDEGSE